MYQLTFYVPESHLEGVKEAVFQAGGGHVGDYSHCCWQTLGQGQFKPGANSNPYSGQINEISQDQEYKVELVCHNETIHACLQALKQAHPYEEPAYQVIELVNL